MTLTLLALIIVPFYLKLVLDPSGSQEIGRNLLKDQTLVFGFSGFYFLLAGLILSTTGLNLSLTLDSLLAWLGVLILVKGLFLLLFGNSKAINKLAKNLKAEIYPLFGLIGILFCLALVYLDLKVLI